MGLNNALNLIKKGVARGKTIGFHAALAYGVRKLHDTPKRMTQAVFGEYSTEDLKVQREATFPREIKFSILVPLYHTPLPFLEELIRSVQEQTYSDWELCFADGSDADHPEVGECVLRYAARDERILYRKLDHNEGISGNSNACLTMATGDYIGLLDHDDLLHPSALYEVMKVICNTQADFIYTDEATFESPDAKRIVSIHYKPDYAPDQLKANNYICHFSVFSRALLDQTECFRAAFDGSQDHDLLLRLTAKAKCVAHIPKVLYLWRSHSQSVAMNLEAKSYATEAGIRAVEAAAEAMGFPAKAEAIPECGSVYRLRYTLTAQPLVSVVIPHGKDIREAEAAAEYLLNHTDYPNFEVLLVGPQKGRLMDRVYWIMEPIKSYGEGCRLGAEQANGAYLLFLDGTLRAEDPSWLSELMMYAQRPDVGAVGAMLVAKNKLQHTGYVLGFGKDAVVGCPYRGYPRKYGGYFHCLRYARDVSAVDGRCLLLKKTDYVKVGGIDTSLVKTLWDVDLCLALDKQGLRQVWTPYALLEQPKAEKTVPMQRETAYFRQKWATVLAKGDPYYNRNFSHRWGGFLIEKK